MRVGGGAGKAGNEWKSVRTAFVDPPRTFTIAMAFRNEFRVRISLCRSKLPRCMFHKTGVPWLDITLEQFLEIPRGPLALLKFFFE